MSKMKRRQQALRRAMFVLGRDHPSVLLWYAASLRASMPWLMARKQQQIDQLTGAAA